MIFLQLKWYWYAILVLLLYIIFLKSCGGSKCPAQTVTTVVKHDTIKVTESLPEYRPVPVIVSQIDTEYFGLHVDTLAIINDYMSKRAYKDTIRNKYGFVTVTDTLYQNKIESRKVIFDFNVPQITLVNEIKPRNQVYCGIDIGSNGSFVAAGLELVVKTKTDKMWWLGASFMTQNTLYYHLGTAWKIKL